MLHNADLRKERKGQRHSWPTVSRLSLLSAVKESKLKNRLRAKLAEGNCRRGDLCAGQSNHCARDCLGTKRTVSIRAKANYTGTMFKTLFYLKTCNQCFREQVAGIFTLNMKLIQSCICEALCLSFPTSLGFCSLLSLITMLLGFSSIPIIPLPPLLSYFLHKYVPLGFPPR